MSHAVNYATRNRFKVMRRRKTGGLIRRLCQRFSDLSMRLTDSAAVAAFNVSLRPLRKWPDGTKRPAKNQAN